MKRIVVGISGASGSPLGVKMLKILRKIKDIQTHLVVSDGAKQTLRYECKKDIKSLADIYYENDNLAAAISSGTFKHDGMIIIPCSMKSVAGLANGFSQNLLLRAADVCIKEKRRLVIVPRETPLSPIHLENLTKLSKLQNVFIVPPVLSYYNDLKTLDDMQIHIIGKILSLFDIDIKEFKRWK